MILYKRLIWGFYYNFTNYNFRKALVLLDNPCQRGEVQCFVDNHRGCC